MGYNRLLMTHDDTYGIGNLQLSKKQKNSFEKFHFIPKGLKQFDFFYRINF